MFINIRNLRGHPERPTIMDFINEDPIENKSKFDAMVVAMTTAGFVLWTHSRNEDNTHIQGLWLSESDHQVCSEIQLRSCRNSLSGIRLDVIPAHGASV